MVRIHLPPADSPSLSRIRFRRTARPAGAINARPVEYPGGITDKKACFRSLGDAWADTTTAHGRLMLTVLGGLAEFERDLVCSRTGEGRERAKARGVKLGRKPKLTEHQKREALRRRDRDGEPVRDIAPQLQRSPQHDF